MSDKNEAKQPRNATQGTLEASANPKTLPLAAQTVSTEASHGSGILLPQHWQQAAIVSTNHLVTFCFSSKCLLECRGHSRCRLCARRQYQFDGIHRVEHPEVPHYPRKDIP